MRVVLDEHIVIVDAGKPCAVDLPLPKASTLRTTLEELEHPIECTWKSAQMTANDWFAIAKEKPSIERPRNKHIVVEVEEVLRQLR